ncbi:hypothetical protein EYF80_003644 [Liparis tanakae]|uniref:Uncharacterized protein n=1 Tax=Liparis tanakae TaxID=230148 RepID=A0A4Z2J878_9TELE|nr:hypothetical protein EYF80_003644 [Liparis tanakae]
MGVFRDEAREDVRTGGQSEEGHIDEDARLVGPSAASAMDAHAHDDPDLAVLTHERTAVIPLQEE